MRHVNTTSLPKQSNLEKRLGQWIHTSQISDFTITRKWKWLFVNGCTCKKWFLIRRNFKTPAEMGQMQECIRGLCWKIIIWVTLCIKLWDNFYDLGNLNSLKIIRNWNLHRLLYASTRFYITINTQKTKKWHNSVVLHQSHFYQDHRQIWFKAVRIQNCVRGDPSKNFEHHTGYLVWGSPWCSLVPPGEFWFGTRN